MREFRFDASKIGIVRRATRRCRPSFAVPESDRILREQITDLVGPEFVAPPARS